MAFGVLLYAMFTYNNAPAGREQLPHDVAIACIAFLFGKFTNGFNRSKPTRWDDKPDAKEGREEQNGQNTTSDASLLNHQREAVTNQGAETRRGVRYRNL